MTPTRRAFVPIAAVVALAALGPIAPAAAQNAAQSAETLPQWTDYIDALRPLGDGVVARSLHPDNAQSRQETWRIMMGTLAQGFIAHVTTDPDYPAFISLFNPALNLAAPNPDYIYTWTPIDGNGTYRIRGEKGTNRFSEFSFGQAFYALGQSKPGTGALDIATLESGPDGAFEVILSAKRPRGYKGNWYKLDTRTRHVLLREAFYDWRNERRGRIAIERLDVPAMRPRASAEEIAQRLTTLAIWTEKGSAIWYDHIKLLQDKGLTNTLGVYDYGAAMGGAVGQVYLEGIFSLAKDEALILETDVPPECRYWGFLLADDQFATIDWVNRQTSLNGFQARLDADGKFRAVITAKDPGVPNWLDTAGYTQGVIQGRWNHCSSAPTPTLTKMPVKEIRKHLPKDTPVVSRGERDQALRERRLAAQLRER